MELIEGKALRGPLPLEEAIPLAIQIADALEAAHERGIIHRDLKPGNIMITAKGAAKLLDFGIAKVCADADATQTLAVMGTPVYMSPEQAEGKPVDKRSDIFSFGAVLYEMLTGNRAFNSLIAVVRDEPAPLPLPVGEVVKRCLAKQAAQRFHNAAELKTALEQIHTRPMEHRQPSIAVLPFANMSAEKDNEYFSDGLAEEIINVLAHIPGLKVIARTSAFAFRGKEQDITKIAEALRVRTILEGSVRRAGNRIRVNAQLINAEDGSHLWSERYDREMADVFAIQDEIAAAIVGALQIKLSVQPVALRQYTPNLPAYEALLRARQQLYKLNPESMTKARVCFEQAIALDPGYALPYSELGGYFGTLAYYGMLPAHEAMPLAREAVQKALDIDSSLPEALAVLGRWTALYDYNWKDAERLFGQAMAREPVPPRVHQLYAVYLLFIDRPERAVEELERALQEDPLNLYFRSTLAWSLLMGDREADAATESRRSLELDENYYMAYFTLSFIHSQQGNLEAALTFAEKAYALAPWYMGLVGYFAGLLRRTGDAGRAATLLQKLGDGKAYGAPHGFFNYHIMCSEVEQAADWAEKTIEQRDPQILYSLRMLAAKDLRSSSRWPALAKMMNLPEAKSASVR